MPPPKALWLALARSVLREAELDMVVVVVVVAEAEDGPVELDGWIEADMFAVDLSDEP